MNGGAFGRFLRPQIRAEAAQHPLAVVAGRLLLDHGGDARRIESGQQNGRLHLRRGDRKLVGDGNGRSAARDGQRQPAAAARHERRAHLPERINHPLHRTAAQRGIAREDRRDRVTRHKAHDEPGRGARITHVQNVLRLQKAADADAVNRPRALAGPLDAGAESAHGGGRCQNILAFQHAFNAGFAHRQATQHQCPVRDRLVSRNTDAPLEGGSRAGSQWKHGFCSVFSVKLQGNIGAGALGRILLTAPEGCGKHAAVPWPDALAAPFIVPNRLQSRGDRSGRTKRGEAGVGFEADVPALQHALL